MDIYDNDGNRIDKAERADDGAKLHDSVNDAHNVSIDYILSQMEKIRADSAYIMEALGQIDKIVSHPPTHNAADYGAQAKAEAIGNIVQAREATNQKMLTMYERMYGDIMSERKRTATDGATFSEKESFLKWAAEMSVHNNLFGQSVGEHVGKIIGDMFK